MLADIAISTVVFLGSIVALPIGVYFLYKAFNPYKAGDTRNPVTPPREGKLILGTVITILSACAVSGLITHWI